MTYTGDRAIFPLTNHRLDKANLLLIAELMQQQLVREKAVYGPTWGALTALTGTWSSPNFTFNACLLFQCYPPSGSLVPEGKVVVFDPTREAQATTSINLAAYVANNRTLLWFKREETDTHDDNQAHWPVNVEVLTTSKTRTSEYVAFEVTNSNVDGTDVDAAKPSISVANGWFPFASVSWSAGAPTIHPIHPMDGGLRKNSSTGALANGILFQHDPLGGGAGYGMSESENIGLYRAVREVVNQIMEIKDQSSRFGLDGKPTTLGALSWRAHPTRSLNTINTDLAVVETWRTPILKSTLVQWSGTLFVLSGGSSGEEGDASVVIGGVVTSVEGDGHKATITISNLPSGYHIFGIDIEPLPSMVAPITQFPTYGNWLPSAALPFSGDGATDLEIEVLLFQMNQGADVAAGDEYSVMDRSFILNIYGKRE